MQAMKIIGDDCVAKGTTKYGGLVGYCLQMHADKPSVFAMISSRAHLPQPNIEVNTEFNEVVYRPAPGRAAMEKTAKYVARRSPLKLSHTISIAN